jgi:branched-subunit amino acid aminotransferase/4-amino-4-deoxychorismate lyase
MPYEAAAAHHPRPDQRHGVFETLLIDSGKAIELDAHLERLAASTRELYGEGPPPGVRELILREAHGVDLGRLRVTVAPKRGGGLEAFATGAGVYPDNVFPRGELAAALSTMVVDRGLGCHKWADRATLERAEAMSPPDTVPLLVREDGTVLEASRANLFISRDGVLLTPPLTLGILPGVARAGVIEVARENDIEVREEEIALDDLFSADEVFLTGSVRGVEPVRAIDDEPIPCPEKATRPLARDLRRRWLGS